MTRHSGSANPCPVIDFDAGFNAWMAYAYGLPKGQTVEQKFGKPFGESLTFTDVLDITMIDAASSVVFHVSFCCALCELLPLFYVASCQMSRCIVSVNVHCNTMLSCDMFDDGRVWLQTPS